MTEIVELPRPAGIIYDVDDTLLNNHPPHLAPYNLHAHTRLEAVTAIAREQSIDALLDVTPEENLEAFLQAKEHSIEGAVWNILHAGS